MITITSRSFEPISADAVPPDFAAGEFLFRAGDAVMSMFLLRARQAELVRHTGHGQKMILNRAGSDHILVEASAWSEVYHCDAVACAPCGAAVLSRDVFKMRLNSNPNMADSWARNLAQAVQAARLRAEIRSLPSVADRLSAWLAEGNHLPDKNHWQDVAAELTVTREALYRELSRR